MKYQPVITVHANETTLADMQKFNAQLEKLMQNYKVWQIWAMLVPEDDTITEEKEKEKKS